MTCPSSLISVSHAFVVHPRRDGDIRVEKDNNHDRLTLFPGLASLALLTLTDCGHEDMPYFPADPHLFSPFVQSYAGCKASITTT